MSNTSATSGSTRHTGRRGSRRKALLYCCCTGTEEAEWNLHLTCGGA